MFPWYIKQVVTFSGAGKVSCPEVAKWKNYVQKLMCTIASYSGSIRLMVSKQQ